MPRDANCVFCKIAAGEIPARVVHETDEALAFLDVNPLAEGHLLLIPRDHYERIVDMPADVLGRLTASLPRLGKTLLQASGAEAFNVLQNNGRASGQVVPHVHFHLIPRRADDGLGYRWNAGSYPPGRDEEMASALRAALGGGA